MRIVIFAIIMTAVMAVAATLQAADNFRKWIYNLKRTWPINRLYKLISQRRKD